MCDVRVSTFWSLLVSSMTSVDGTGVRQIRETEKFNTRYRHNGLTYR